MRSGRRASSAIAYLVAELLSSAGNVSSMIVVPWLVLAFADDVALVSWVSAWIAVTGLVGGVASAAIIARLGARTASIAADSTAAAGALLLALALLGGDAMLPAAFFAGGALLGLGDVPGATAKQSLLDRVAARAGVRRDRLSGMRYIAFVAAWIGAPLGVGLGLTEAADAMVLAVATAHAGAAAAILLLRLPAGPRPARGPSGFARLRTAWRAVRADPALRAAAVCQATSTALSLPLTSLYLVATASESGSSAFLGIAFTTLALGVLGGNVAYLLVHRPSRRRTMMWVSLGSGTVGFVVLASGPVLVPMLGALLLLGLALGLLAPLWAVIPAERVTEDARADVLAVQNTGALVSGPVAVVVVGQVMAGTGTAGGAIALSAIWALSAVFLVATRAPSRLT